MSTENAALMYEAGQTAVAITALTDAGDHKTFNSTARIWSMKSGKAPVVKINGLLAGGLVTPADSGTSDKIDVAWARANIAGAVVDVNASTDLTVTRGLSTDTHIINSLTINSSGAFAVIAGTDGPSFSTSRGAAGGPPWIPTGSIEIAQIKLTSITAAAVTEDEIDQTVGVSQELADEISSIVMPCRVANTILGYAGVDMVSAFSAIHSDDAGSTVKCRKVYASYYTVSFATLQQVSDVKIPETTHSLSSTPYYGGAVASISPSRTQASFTAYLSNGIADPLIALKNSRLWFKFFPDQDDTDYHLFNGTLGLSRAYPASGAISAACTISCNDAAEEVRG